jgi:hypothetical protein
MIADDHTRKEGSDEESLPGGMKILLGISNILTYFEIILAVCVSSQINGKERHISLNCHNIYLFIYLGIQIGLLIVCMIFYRYHFLLCSLCVVLSLIVTSTVIKIHIDIENREKNYSRADQDEDYSAATEIV